MKFDKGRIVTLILLVVFVLIVILPPIIYGYTYPNLGDDCAEHLRMLDEMVKLAIQNS